MKITVQLLPVLFILLLSTAARPQSALQVQAVLPLPQQLAVASLPQISIVFNQAVDPQTITPQSFQVFGRWSGVMRGGMMLVNGNRELRFVPDRRFNNGETVIVSLTRAIRSASGGALTRGYAWQFWIGTSPGGMNLQEVARVPVRRPGEGRIQTYGANAADLNGDGYTDYMVPNEIANDVRVFLNDGAGNYDAFTVHSLANAARPSTNEAADFNGDGFTDFAVGNTQNERVHILLGDGAGGFSAVTSYPAGSGVRGLCLLDLDGDGQMDIVTANRNADNLAILRGKGDGTFDAAITIDGGGSQETACAAADANNDGIMDVFVGALGSQELILLLGDGAGNLTLSAKVGAGGSPWMIATGDVDGDGNVDVVSANSNAKNSAVARGDGNGGLFPAVNYTVGAVFPLAIDLGDLDGDGDLDMLVSSFGQGVEGSGQWTLLENDGSGNFGNPRYFDASAAASCAVFHDRDNDGDLDVTGIDEIDDLLFIFDNPPVGIGTPGRAGPHAFILRQNFPNPFNPATRISFSLPFPVHVTLTIFDVHGRIIQTLLDEHKPVAGTYSITWDGRDNSGTAVASGIYYYRLRAGGALQQTRKMILLR